MRIFIKLLLFLCLIVAIIFFSVKLNQSLNKELKFGDEYIGLTDIELIEEFGNPDVVKNLKFQETDEYFHYFFEYFKNDCNENNQVRYFLYDKLLIDYEFWFVANSRGENEVVLVK